MILKWIGGYRRGQERKGSKEQREGGGRKEKIECKLGGKGRDEDENRQHKRKRRKERKKNAISNSKPVRIWTNPKGKGQSGYKQLRM